MTKQEELFNKFKRLSETISNDLRIISSIKRTISRITPQTIMKRRKLFNYLIRNVAKVPEGNILPRWGIALQFILFPLKSFHHWSNKQFYDVATDIWTIQGMRYSGVFFDHLSLDKKMVLVVKLNNQVISLKAVR